MDEVPCIIASDLTDEQIKALRLADNKVGELAEWDEALLNIELDELLDFDMSDFGFDFEDEAGGATSGEEQGNSQKEYQNTSTEISVDDYADENFQHECPRCKFRFND